MALSTRDFKQFAEEYIDSQSLANAIDTLAEVCRDKAGHLRSTWQDETAAKEWESAARKLDRYGEKTGYPWSN